MLELFVAFRLLIKNKTQTIISLVVIIIGTATFHFILNGGTALKNLAFSVIAESNSHIYITGDFDFVSYEDENIIDFRKTLFKKDSQIKDISYALVLNGIVNDSDGNQQIINLKGIDFEIGGNIQQLKNRVPEELIPRDQDEYEEDVEYDGYDGEVAIGDRLARQIGIDVEKFMEDLKLDPTIDQKERIIFQRGFDTYTFRIMSIIASDQVEINKIIYTTIATAQKINNNSKEANVIEIRVKDPLKSNKVFTKIESTILDYYPDASIIEWQEGNGYAVNALFIEDISLIIIQVFSAIAIAFGVGGIFLLNTKQKTNQIGILKAMGVDSANTRLIFLYQALMLLIVGVIVGLMVGCGLAEIFMLIFRRPSRANVPLIYLPTHIWSRVSLISSLVILFSSLVVMYFPIRYAEKLRVIEVIKNE